MPRYLTAPSRFLVIISTFVVALVLLLASSVMAAGPEPATVDYRVRSGDTLWTIAEEVAPEDNDVRGVISEIRHLNELDSSMIIPGETLLVPAR
jgi:LysM repeat protein